MRLNRSQWLLVLASLVTLLLTWQTSRQERATATSLPTRVLAVGSTDMANIDQGSALLTLPERTLTPLQSDLFAPPVIIVAKPQLQQARVQAAPKPVAPPLPFKYVGRWQDQEKSTVMIDYRGDIIPIKQGDMVAGQYKVLAINTPPAGVQIQFLMVPFNQIQTMQAGVAP